VQRSLKGGRIFAAFPDTSGRRRAAFPLESAKQRKTSQTWKKANYSEQPILILAQGFLRCAANDGNARWGAMQQKTLFGEKEFSHRRSDRPKTLFGEGLDRTAITHLGWLEQGDSKTFTDK